MGEIHSASPYENGMYLGLKTLRQRGWTARLVRTFLGKPDLMHRVSGTPSGRLQNLYCIKRVALVEASDPAFIAEKRRTECYAVRLEGVQAKKKQTLAGVVESMTLPNFEWHLEELLRYAEIKQKIDKNLLSAAVERVALEILMASMTSLRWRLEIYSGHVGIRDARTLLRNRMLAHIVTRYPPLSETAKKYADESAGAGTERKCSDERFQ